MRNIGAFIGAFLAMCLAGTAQAIPTITDIEGNISAAENTCVSPIQFFQFTHYQLCSYSGGVDIQSVVPATPTLDFHNWMGPVDSGGFYTKGFLQSPRTDGGYSGSSQGDGKVPLDFTGSITIEDFNTPDNPNDDRISGTLVFGPGARGVSSSNGNAVEEWDSLIHTIPVAIVSSATPNATTGGYDYVIGSQGFPLLLTSAAGDYPSEVPSIATDSPVPPDFNAWEVSSGGNITLPPYQAPPLGGFVPHTVEIVSYAPGAAGNSNVEPNIGVATKVVAENLTCVSGDADSTPDMTDPAPPDLPEMIDDCNPDPAIGAGSTWSVSGAEFDNLILKISTNANNRVVSADAFYVLEYKIEALNLNAGKPGSWVGGTLKFAGITGAEDDNAKTPPGIPVDIDILANDTGFADPVTISLPGGGASVNGGTVTINGTNPGPQADIDVTYNPPGGFEGQDSFEYTINGGLPVLVNIKVSDVIARDTTVLTGEGQPVDILISALPGVRLGQSPSTTTVVGPPGSGMTSVSGHVITYTPVSFPASDDFEYRIEDANGKSDTGTVFVNIFPHLLPTAVDDVATVMENSSVNIDVLANDIAGSGAIEDHQVDILLKFIVDIVPSDPDPGRAAVSGTAVLEADNTITYTPDPNVSGTHTFQYTLTDIGGTDGPDESAPATVTVTVEKVASDATLPTDSSTAIGPWSLMMLTVIGWLRRRRNFVRINRQFAMLACIAMTSVVLAMAAGPVDAQETEADEQALDVEESTPEPKKKLRVEEIVVTARKKEESLQDVPIAITAFSAEGIDRAGISSLADVAAFTPGLTFSNLFGEFLAVPVIRGVAPTAIFGENNVAVFIDGVFVSGREGINAAQLDLARIEVLKGPQSTKYGRNAFAGAINYVTARPGEELEGEAKVNVGNYDKRQARLTISGPLVGDKLTGRIALGIDEWSGSYNNSLSNLDIGGYQYKTLQTSLWFTPSEALDIQWAVYLSDDEIDDSARATLAANCEDRQDLQLKGIAPPNDDTTGDGVPDDNGDWSDGPRPQNFCGTLPSLADNTLAINDQSTGEERELTRSSLKIDWDIGWGSIAALTGYSKTNQVARNDSNQTQDGTVPYLYVTTSGERDVFSAELTTVGNGDEVTEWSQELRYSTPLDNPMRLDVGGYWYSVESKGGFTDFTARLADGSGQRLPDDFAGLYPGAGVIGDAIFGPRFENTVGDIVPDSEKDISDPFINNTESWSLFAGLELDFTERLTADIGARYSQDMKRLRGTVRGLDFSVPPEDPAHRVAVPIDESRRFDYWTGRAGLRFQITDDNMVYTSVSNGKKSGGMDLIFGDELTPRFDDNGNPILDDDGNQFIDPIPVAVITEFDIEEITAYELGNKGTIWDSRAQYDVAFFYNDWTDILMPQILDTNPETGLEFEQPEGVDLTGGDATTYGVEASLALILTEHWDVNFGGSWTNAEYDDAELAGLRLWPSFWNDTTGPDGVPDGRGDAASIKGNDLLRQSEWTGFFTLNYIKPVSGEWEFYSRSDVLYTGEQWVGADNQAKVPANTNVNQRLGFETEKIRLEFWVNNLFDQDNPVAAFRDVTFNNTHLQDNVINRPPQDPYGGFSDMFPFRMTISYPKRRTFGVSALVKF